MKSLKIIFGLLVACLLVPCASADIMADVRLNTAALIGGTTGPYYLEFQLVDGDGVQNNAVTLSDFQFVGGASTGTASLIGGAAGDLSSIVTLVDSSFFNEFYQSFIPGTEVRFKLAFTTNFIDPTPDMLSIAVLNSALLEVPTAGPGNELISVDLRQPIQFNTYSGIDLGTDPVMGAPTVAAVPEPGSLILGITMLAGCLAVRKLWR